jgi:galactose mutarotase-like enzyme
MVCRSLAHRGEELLGQRGGLERYVAEHGTMGIPFLHPYANRLRADSFELGGRTVDVGRAPGRAGRDPNGLAIHGLLAGAAGWEVVAADEGRLSARFDWAADDELAAAFPFPHVVTLDIALVGSSLRIGTQVEATGDADVPVSFGFHPYLCLPGVPREEWAIEVPVAEHVLLDERSLPTGERSPVTVEPGPLGSRTFDDVYAGVADGTVFAASGGGRRLEVEFESGYPVAVVYAPDNDDVICFEPMTAPTNAMIDGAPELRFVAPGERFAAAWTLRVADS